MYLLTHQKVLEKNPQLLLHASSDKAILDAIRNSQMKSERGEKK